MSCCRKDFHRSSSSCFTGSSSRRSSCGRGDQASPKVAAGGSAGGRRWPCPSPGALGPRCPHLAVHLGQEPVQHLLPVPLLPAHLGHQLLHHVVQLLRGGVKLHAAHFALQGTLVGLLPGERRRPPGGRGPWRAPGSPPPLVPQAGGPIRVALTTSISISRCPLLAFSFSSFSRPWYSTWEAKGGRMRSKELRGRGGWGHAARCPPLPSPPRRSRRCLSASADGPR